MSEALKIAIFVVVVLVAGGLGAWLMSFQRPNNPLTKKWAANHPDTAARWQSGPNKSGQPRSDDE